MDPMRYVLDHGFVRLDATMADDLSVVNAARVSFARTASELDEAGEGLIAFLMRERHGTPFEHNAFRWHIKAPIFVAREWMRHRVGSFNEWSGRYSKLEPEFYIPAEFRTQVGKPGAYSFEPIADPEKRDLAATAMESLYHEAWVEYEYLLKLGVAREQASRVLPLATYTQFYWTVNARSLMNFLSLRNSDQAQWEIRQYAVNVEALFAEQMPITAQAFINHERVAP